MLTDNEFDIVYLSEYMKEPISKSDQDLARLYRDLESILNRYGYTPRILPYKRKVVGCGQLALWCRDYMPVTLDANSFVRFSYTPDYLKYKRYKGCEPDVRWTCNTIGCRAINLVEKVDENGVSPIIIDGGNIVRCGDKVVMTDKIFHENPAFTKVELIRTLERYFNAKIVFLPWDRRDSYGHADGVVRYLGGNKVVMPTYGNPLTNRKDKVIDHKYRRFLSRYFDVLPLDFSDIDESDKWRWAYINWLQLKDLIIMPCFKDTPLCNERAMTTLKEYTKDSSISIEMVEATDLVSRGGGLNRASWTISSASIPADMLYPTDSD